MSVRASILRGTRRVLPLAVAAFLLLAATTAQCDQNPTPEEAIEKARVLERQGLIGEAESYLAQLLDENDGVLARHASVLLEAARLATEPETSRAYASRAIDRSRSDEVLETAYMLRGDAFFAEGLYQTASVEYRSAARHSSEREPGVADLKHARSILASGDANGAFEAYREMAGRGATPGEITPHAEVGLARTLLVLGRFTEAAEQFERTADVYKDSEVRRRALAGAAESHESAGALDDARAALEAIVADYPESYEAVLARERLRSYARPDTADVFETAADSTQVAEPAEPVDE